MYTFVPREQIAETLIHLRGLFRQIQTSSQEEHLAREKREILTKNLLSNIFRTKEHPTINSVLDVAEAFSLTLDGAHRLFGYQVQRIRDFDLELNAAHTRIVETYPFERDQLVELPSRLAHDREFMRDAAVHDLVLDWHAKIPIRTLESSGWQQPNAFYVRVGTEDSLGSSLPPGSLALVAPIDDVERLRPNPRNIYLLQFGNGYRCSRCVVTRGKLILLSSSRKYDGPQEFAYPSGVRIAGRVRMFALGLPLPNYPVQHLPPPIAPNAPLILPWEHPSMDRLFWTEHRRLRRLPGELPRLREQMKGIFHTNLSDRTQRRYRRPTSSLPHVDVLIQLTISHATRYSDVLRLQRPMLSDHGRYSLETLLGIGQLRDLRRAHHRPHLPGPRDQWSQLRSEFIEWPSLLSDKYPELRAIDSRVIRLKEGIALKDLDPSVGSGSILLLDKPQAVSNLDDDPRWSGWSRRLYAFRKGDDVLCGRLVRNDNRYLLLIGSSENESPVFLSTEDVSQLHQVCGVAVPV